MWARYFLAADRKPSLGLLTLRLASKSVPGQNIIIWILYIKFSLYWMTDTAEVHPFSSSLFLCQYEWRTVPEGAEILALSMKSSYILGSAAGEVTYAWSLEGWIHTYSNKSTCYLHSIHSFMQQFVNTKCWFYTHYSEANLSLQCWMYMNYS